MADTKTTALTAVDAPVATDIFPMVDDPSGTPVTKKVTFQQAADWFSALSATLTNKAITKRVSTTTSSATPTPNASTDDVYTVTALAEAATFGAPTGSPVNLQSLILRIKDNGTARALSFNAIYRFSSDLTAPTTTVINKTLYLGFFYNSADTKWDCVAKLNNF